MIRLARAEELDRVNELRREVNLLHVQARPDAFKPGFSAEVQHLAEEFLDRGGLWVALRRERVVGYAMVEEIRRPETPYRYADNYWSIDEIGVEQANRRQGVATELVRFLQGEARRRGVGKIELSVWDFNAGAQRFYQAMALRRAAISCNGTTLTVGKSGVFAPAPKGPRRTKKRARPRAGPFSCARRKGKAWRQAQSRQYSRQSLVRAIKPYWIR